MFSSPPSTITTPAAQRTRGPYALFQQLGNGHHAGVAERLNAKAGDADKEHRQAHENAWHRAGKAVLVAVFGRIHAGDDAELGGRQGGDSQEDVHFAAGDEEVLDLAHVFADHDAGDHRRHQVHAHDRSVDSPREAVLHAFVR